MVAPHRLLALLSGGKDSVYATLCARSAGHTVVAAAHITPPGHHVDGDSYMYQAVASEAVASVAAALGLPLHTRPSRGVAVASPQQLGYVPTTGDEVEDLTALLLDAKAAVAAAANDSTGGGGPLTGVVVGALWSDYQRLRVESAAARAGLLVVAPLWRAEQGRLLRRMAAYGLAPVVVKVGAMGLRVADVGAPLMGLLDRLDRLSQLYGVHVAGEGGEYESLVLDAPAFVSRLALARVEVVVDREDKWAPSARLLIHEVTSVAKDGGVGALPVLPPEPAAFGGGRGEDLAQVVAVAAADTQAWARADPARWAAAVVAADATPTDATAAAASSGGSADGAAAGTAPPAVATHVATSPCGGYAHMSVTATTPVPQNTPVDTADDAVAAAATASTVAAMAAATAAVTTTLAASAWSPTDAVAVFIALPTCAPAVYAAANAVYAAAWPPAVVNPPPTRAAVAVGGPPPTSFPADEGANSSGAAESAAVTIVTIEVALCRDRGTAGLHVQSLSPWAPPCIGPYAQAVMPVGEGVAYLSGALALRQLHIPWALTAAGCAAELATAKAAKISNAAETGTASSPTPPSDNDNDTAAMLAAARQTRATMWNVGATLQAIPGASLTSALFIAVFVVRPTDAAPAVAAVTRRLGAPAEADRDLHWPSVSVADGVAPPPADGPDGGPVVSAVPAAGLPRDAAVEVVVVAGVPAPTTAAATTTPAGGRVLPHAAAAAVGGGSAGDPTWGTATWRWASRGGALTWLALRLRRPTGGMDGGGGVTAATLAAAVAAAVASLGSGRVLLSARVWTVATAAAARRLGWAANREAGCGGGGGGESRDGSGGVAGRAVWTVHPSAWVPHGDAAVVHAVVVAPAQG
ncbi:hypothetical protein MMPV_001143 [Pyropia vietnamensis]